MRRVLLVLSITLIFSNLVVAQVPPGVPGNMPSSMSDMMSDGDSGGGGTGAVIQIKSPLIEGIKGNFNATFQNSSISELVQLFSMQSGLNVLISPKINATFTANFRNAALMDAFKAVLSANNLYYLQDGNIIKILTLNEYKEELKKKFLVTKTYDASIIDLKNLVSVIKPLLIPGVGSVTMDAQSSKIMVTDVEDNFERIDKVIKEVSSVPKMVEIETKIVQVSLENDDELGIKWELLNIDNALDLQFNFAPSGGVADEALNLVGTKSLSPNPMSISALISVLATYYDVKLVAAPRVLAMNRGSANIHIGDNVPYIKSVIKSSTTSEQTSQIEFLDVGIKLEVWPTITENNEVKIKLKIEQSSYSFIAITSTENAPKKITTTVDCEAVSKNEGTIVIGGLIRTEKSENIKGIPFISKIPVLKYFFSHTEAVNNRSELVIFLTPHIIEGGASNVPNGKYSEKLLKEAELEQYIPSKTKEKTKQKEEKKKEEKPKLKAVPAEE